MTVGGLKQIRELEAERDAVQHQAREKYKSAMLLGQQVQDLTAKIDDLKAVHVLPDIDLDTPEGVREMTVLAWSEGRGNRQARDLLKGWLHEQVGDLCYSIGYGVNEKNESTGLTTDLYLSREILDVRETAAKLKTLAGKIAGDRPTVPFGTMMPDCSESGVYTFTVDAETFETTVQFTCYGSQHERFKGSLEAAVATLFSIADGQRSADSEEDW